MIPLGGCSYIAVFLKPFGSMTPPCTQQTVMESFSSCLTVWKPEIQKKQRSKRLL